MLELLLAVVILETIVLVAVVWRTRKRTKYDGALFVYKNEGKKLFSIELEEDLDKVELLQQLRIKVRKLN